MSFNKPACSFVGYRLLNAKLNRGKDGFLTDFTIRSSHPFNINNTNRYKIDLKITMTFNNTEECEFIYDACYEINDPEFLKGISDVELTSLFVSMVFPFIRKTLIDITDDSRGSIFIPTIDLRFADLIKGVNFKIKTSN